MNMSEKMKEKGIPATSVKRSKDIVKKISKGDKEELNHNMRPIMEQNRREYIAGLETSARNNFIYGSSNDIQQEGEQKNISDMTQEELMEFVRCLNQCMVDYEEDVQRAMKRSERQEWESLKGQHCVSAESKKVLMNRYRISSTKKSE